MSSTSDAHLVNGTSLDMESLSLGKNNEDSISPASNSTPKDSASSDTQDLLEGLSSYFEVGTTKYGGRGCFALADIPLETVLLRARQPVGSAVVRPFRKEVCTWCFQYHDGKTLKFRIDGKVYFCSQECLEAFGEYDPESVLSTSLCALETLYLQCEGDDDYPEDTSNLEQEWAAVAEWEKKVFSIKASKRRNLYPKVNKDDYGEIRYVLGVLYTQYKTSLSRSRDPEPSETSQSEVFEEQLFHLLQSSEQEKVQKYPYLGRSYINIYKLVRLASAPQLVRYVNTQNIRDIIGRNLTNAFGIWSPTTQPGEEREFFGFGVYPSGSFFNHSCAPNVEKTRTGASYEFRTSCAVSKGDELCISYGVSDEDVVERRKMLSEWFFFCSCSRCMQEAAK